MYQPAQRTSDFPDRRGETIELGFTPPLDAGMRRHALDERRRVSTRWLSATILTGIFGGSLMGLAVVAALDTQSDFAEQPEYVAQQPSKPITDPAVATARKGDKLVRKVDLLSAKQSFKTPTTTRAGEKEVIKVKAFSRVSAPLLLASTDFKDEVPAFNPVKVMADGATDRAAEATPAPDDASADVSLATADLSAMARLPLNGATLAEDEARRQANDVFNQPRSRSAPSLMMTPQSMLARSMKRAPDVQPLGYADIGSQPFSGLEVRMVPENVTVVPRLETPVASALPEEKVVIVKKGETGEAILRAAGAKPGEAKAAASMLAPKESDVSEGKRLKILFAALSPSDPTKSLVRVMLYKDETVEAMTAVNDKGVFVSVQPPADTNTPASHGEEDDENGDDAGIRLFNSLYETGLKNDVPKPVLESLVRIFSYDVDFQRKVSGGDTFDVLYAEDDDVGIQKGDVLYASISVGGETKNYYRFMTPDDNNIDYYDEAGRSARKFLMRKPVIDAQMRSGFGFRYHPILGYGKMHTGVDWANKVGTPILAAGNGTVIKAEWDSGYGRRTEIQHINGYVTTYNHQSAFAKGIVPGAKVRQGQVIGYIGASGLATGPHLHYEVIVNDHFVDPMRIKLPRGRELDGKMLAEFKREHDRIDELLKRSPGQNRVVAQALP